MEDFTPSANDKSASAADVKRRPRVTTVRRAPADAPTRAATFKKFRELLMLKRFEGRDNVPVQVVPGLFIGSLGAASNLEGLQAAGITHILCVTASLPLQFPELFVCERLPLADLPSAPLDSVIPSGMAFIDSAIADGGRVLVHCFVGRSRSASMVLAYLMCRHAMTLDAAMQLLKSVRPQVQPNSGFLAHLKTLESQLPLEAAQCPEQESLSMP